MYDPKFDAIGEDGETRVSLYRRPKRRNAPRMLVADPKFVDALNNFVSLQQARLDAHYKERGLSRQVLSLMPGVKNVRVVIAYENGENRSVHCFIDKSNGDILKAAGWSAPAEHARGNIYNANPLEGMTLYGAEYITR